MDSLAQEDNQLYVMKKLETKTMSKKDSLSAKQEVQLLQRLRHPCIVAYKDSFTTATGTLCIVMAYCEAGDLSQRLSAAKQKRELLKEEDIIEWIIQIALSLHFLHGQRILHRDLKSKNIFLQGGSIKLGDFGIAKVLGGTGMANTMIGTPMYMAPEQYNEKPYGFKTDMWSFGCVAYEACTGNFAFQAQNINALARKVKRAEYPPIPSRYSKELRQLIGSMLSKSPKQRPTCAEVLQRPELRAHAQAWLSKLVHKVCSVSALLSLAVSHLPSLQL
jgi:serine/threonine protein kinase